MEHQIRVISYLNILGRYSQNKTRVTGEPLSFSWTAKFYCQLRFHNTIDLRWNQSMIKHVLNNTSFHMFEMVSVQIFAVVISSYDSCQGTVTNPLVRWSKDKRSKGSLSLTWVQFMLDILANLPRPEPTPLRIWLKILNTCAERWVLHPYKFDQNPSRCSVVKAGYMFNTNTCIKSLPDDFT